MNAPNDLPMTDKETEEFNKVEDVFNTAFSDDYSSSLFSDMVSEPVVNMENLPDLLPVSPAEFDPIKWYNSSGRVKIKLRLQNDF